eukprot:TRINITY_DN11308_c0_g1_i1.p1 TRINITY_DN11308_c0_g1~~TRINITY_DN11308_c0_g1_i1.p1  ORF type:complete len:145 (-),score=47.76 TRINITY_DN11308_c0_g1_i1:196-630(-)
MAAQQLESEENASELNLGEEFNRAKCLMNAEVAMILERKQETLQGTDIEPNPQLTSVFEKSLAYVKRFSRYSNPEAVKQVRELLTNQRRLHEFEVCVIGNLAPETVDEVKALVPSLLTVAREPLVDEEFIEQLLQDLANIKKFE